MTTSLFRKSIIFGIISFSIFTGYISESYACTSKGSNYSNCSGSYSSDQIAKAEAAGLQMGPDGSYTDASIRAFQAKAGITVDGMIGPETMGQIMAGTVSVAGEIPEPPAGGGGSSEGGGAVGSTSTESKTIDIYVTEEIPGANCRCVANDTWGNDGTSTIKDDDGNIMPSSGNCTNPKNRKYVCTVDKGLVAFQGVFQAIVRWFVYIAMILGVVAIIGVGILWAWGSDSEEYAKKAKGWAMNIVVGLILLFTFRYILGFLAPWIFR